MNKGFTNVIPVLDNLFELDKYERGIITTARSRSASGSHRKKSPNLIFILPGLGSGTMISFPIIKEKIKNNPKFELKMLHFFINTGIKDTAYYWNELQRAYRFIAN